MSERYSRNVLFFGAAGQARLSAKSVVVVGVGGIGSHVVQQLALLGVGKITLVDDEELAESNRNRYVTARHSDPIPGSSKVTLGERLAGETNPGLEVKSVAKHLQSAEALRSIIESDYVFGCVDNDVPRVILTELCAAYAKPYFDLASDIHVKESSYGGRVCTAWDGHGCLICLRQIDLLGIQEELAGAAAREDRKAIYGMPKNDLGDSGPSVVSINGVIASLGVTEFLLAVTGIKAEPRKLLTYRANLGVVNRGQNLSAEDCYYCSALWAKGIGAGVEQRYFQHSE